MAADPRRESRGRHRGARRGHSRTIGRDGSGGGGLFGPERIAGETMPVFDPVDGGGGLFGPGRVQFSGGYIHGDFTQRRENISRPLPGTSTPAEPRPADWELEIATQRYQAEIRVVKDQARAQMANLHHQLKALREQLSAAQQELREERKRRELCELREKGLNCLVCHVRAVGIRGIQCDAGLHFLCQGCLSDHVTAVDERKLTKDGDVPCSEQSCKAGPLSNIESYLSESALKSLRLKRKSVTEQQAVAEARSAWEAERKREWELARSGVQAAVKRATIYVVEELLLLKCPNGHAFIDFDGCSALACNQCKPRVYFCAWCLKAAVNSQDAHRHVAGCTFRRSKDPLYPTPAEWKKGTLERQRKQLHDYLVDEVSNKHTHAVKEAIRKIRPDLLTTRS